MIRRVYVSLPFECILCNWYVRYTYDSSLLIQIGMEPLRNKRMITYYLPVYLNS